MNQPWVYMCSPSWDPLPPPSLSHPSGSSQYGCWCSDPALSTLTHTLNLDWWSISHMIIYMFKCYSFKSSHPHLPPLSPKDCSIRLCLFCFLAYRVIVTIFLIPYICVNILYWCFSFWLTSLCIIGSSFIHLTRTDSNVLFLWLSNTPLYICTTAFLSIHLPINI